MTNCPGKFTGAIRHYVRKTSDNLKSSSKESPCRPVPNADIACPCCSSSQAVCAHFGNTEYFSEGADIVNLSVLRIKMLEIYADFT